MWLVRLLIREASTLGARPEPFQVGPSSTIALEQTSGVARAASPFARLGVDDALGQQLEDGLAGAWGANRRQRQRVVRPSATAHQDRTDPTGLYVGATRTKRATANAQGSSPSSFRVGR
jgi:hypothetical protein